MVDLRYFMNMRYRGRLIPDYEGDELPNEEARARACARHSQRSVFRTRMDTIRSWFDCTFEVTDQSGRIVLVMPFDVASPKFSGSA